MKPHRLIPWLTPILLAACASSAPPAQLYHLRSAPPLAAPAPVAPARGPWQLLHPVRLPDYLDRDAILVPRGQAGLATLSGHRWAEPLAEGVPRVLRQDLALLLGEAALSPATAPAQAQLRLEISSFEATPERRAVQLQARWSLQTGGGAPVRSNGTRIEVPVAGAEVDALVAAHRLALWRLAEQLAVEMRAAQ